MPFPLLPALGFYGGHLLAFALLGATAWVLGRLLLARLPLAPGWESFAVPAALGVAALAHLAFLLGLVHALKGPVLVAALVFIHLAGWRQRIWNFRSPTSEGGRVPPPGEGEGWVRGEARRGALRLGKPSLPAALALLPLFLLALYPPTAFDATLYHLPDARAFARLGSVPFLVGLRFPVFPQLAEVLYAAVLLLAGDLAVQLVPLLSILLTAALLAAWGEGAVSRRAGIFAAAAYLGGPIVLHMGTCAYIDAALALCTTGAVYSLWRYRRAIRPEGEGRSGAPGWLALSAVFGASAADIKYLGLFFLAAAGLAVLLGRPRRPARVLLFSAVAAAVLLPVYGRIFFYTGNPLFPYLPGIFGHTDWDPMAYGARSAGHALATLATLPWDVLFARAKVGAQPPFSPFLLLGLPLLALFAPPDRRVRPWLLLALSYIALFPLLPADARYLLPAVPLVCLALGASLDRPALAPRSAAVLAVVLFLPGWLYAGYRIARQGAPPVTEAGRARYLTARLPLYPAIAWLNRERGRDYKVYGFFAENMTYFAEGTLLGDWDGPARFQTVLPDVADPEALWRRLRGLGAGYMLVPRDRGGFGIPDTAAWQRRFQKVYEDGAAEIFVLKPFRSGAPDRSGPV